MDKYNSVIKSFDFFKICLNAQYAVISVEKKQFFIIQSNCCFSSFDENASCIYCFKEKNIKTIFVENFLHDSAILFFCFVIIELEIFKFKIFQIIVKPLCSEKWSLFTVEVYLALKLLGVDLEWSLLTGGRYLFYLM